MKCCFNRTKITLPRCDEYYSNQAMILSPYSYDDPFSPSCFSFPQQYHSIDIIPISTKTCVLISLDSQLSVSRNTLNLGKVPLLVTERTHTPCLEPPLNAVQVKHVSTVAKGNAQAIVVGG